MKKDMTDVMIDLETFGHGYDACIVQVGAAYFDRVSGEVGDTLKMNIDAASSQKYGFRIDASTVYWWLSQSDEARASISDSSGPKYDLKEAMTELNDFLGGAYVWSHATFDYPILSGTLKQLGIKQKFHFRMARDVRTIIDICQVKISKIERVGTHHDALDDALFQIKCVVAGMNAIYEDL